jgi:phosphoribosylanthranilate isomerase
MVEVKVCGITNADDARLAAELGAAMLGFNFYRRSPRYIAPAAAAAIVAGLPAGVEAVGVFVNATVDDIVSAVAATGSSARSLGELERRGIRTVQLHGDEPADFCRQLRRRMPGLGVIKAFRTEAGFAPEIAARYPAQALLIDAAGEAFGGSGRQANWEEARKLAQLLRATKDPALPKLILAGGLTPANVAEGIRRVQPQAVDVCSGVEAAKGRKDHSKLRDFFAAVRSASMAECNVGPAALGRAGSRGRLPLHRTCN